ncbi:MAG TPA: ferredoxin--NADP reductase [Candidatus Limnocylindrales bacterium]
MAAEYNATVIGRVEVAPGLVSMRIAPDKLPFEFKPGQYVALGLKATEPRVEEADADGPSVVAGEGSAGTPESQSAVEAQATAAARAAADPDRMIRRAYCIASESRAGEYLEFYLTLILSGELTPRLFNLRIRDRLYVGPKAEGVFTLDRAQGKHILMIGTGTGLAPYMSMLRNELAMRVDGRLGVRALVQCNGLRHFVMVHGARYSWDLGYRSELTGLARHCANFHYLPAITRPHEDTTWRGRSGYLQNVIASGAIEKEVGMTVTPENFDILLCGNPGMIETVIGWAEARGFTRDRGHNIGTLHVEEYW